MRNQVAAQHINIVCYERTIVIETDGRRHLDSERDKARDIDLAACGFRVLRFRNNDILTTS
jgi:very-short-patch-repair endonuclease